MGRDRGREREREGVTGTCQEIAILLQLDFRRTGKDVRNYQY